MVENYDRRLSRFRPDSELCALNADPRERVPASPLLRGAVKAALWAAERSGGLVDPTLLGELERAGYVESLAPRATRQPRGPGAAGVAPPDSPPRPARPRRRRPLARDPRREERDRPAARAAARPRRLRQGPRRRPRRLHPRQGAPVGRRLRRGRPGRRGRRPGGRRRPSLRRRGRARDARSAAPSPRPRSTRASWAGGHHIIDPATGEPAWTGVVSATAFADSTLEAETLAKVALLAGTPDVLDQGHVVMADGKVVPR